MKKSTSLDKKVESITPWKEMETKEWNKHKHMLLEILDMLRKNKKFNSYTKGKGVEAVIITAPYPTDLFLDKGLEEEIKNPGSISDSEIVPVQYEGRRYFLRIGFRKDKPLFKPDVVMIYDKFKKVENKEKEKEERAIYFARGINLSDVKSGVEEFFEKYEE